MKIKIIRHLTSVLVIICCCSLSNCDPNNHKASNHPCNFPNAETENSLREPWSYKIIDKVTSKNLVDTTRNASIHADSVILMDENLEVIPSFRNGSVARLPYRYYIDNWIFDNLTPYKDVPFNDPAALLNLKERTFYLRTAYNDIDTIKISFNQCLIKPPLSFNGSLNTGEPKNEISGYASFYFRK